MVGVIRDLLTIGFVIVAFGLSGCMGFGGDVSGKYDDANRHYGEKFDGEATETKTVSIPNGMDTFRVALAIKVAGSASVELMNPLGVEVNDLQRDGTADVKDDEWYKTDNPMQGDWKIEIHAGGSGSYGVGFYYS